MTIHGELIHRASDEYGELRVFDDGAVRTLCFGESSEQSACLKANPGLLLFEYTQAMLLSQLFVDPRRVLCLGLGAGSLATALHRACPAALITAVELRQSVIDAARAYFYLPAEIEVHCQDAGRFIAQDKSRYDLIFSDLYTSEGLSSLQLQRDFLRSCAARLSPEGLMVINCWQEHQNQAVWLALLSELFVDLRICSTGDGNWLIFAARWLLESNPLTLRAAAQPWSARLGFSLQRHLKGLTSYEAPGD